jgi:cytidylate kinase
MSFAAARRFMHSDDGKHAWFMLHAFGQDVDDPAHFDVVLNTETYRSERAIGLVLMAYLAKFGDWPPTALH